MYLEKLTIEKDNSLFALNKKNKKLEKTSLDYITKVEALESLNKKLIDDH